MAAQKAVHIVIQGKGGCGKSWVAKLIAEYLLEKGEMLAFDMDATNRTLSELKILKAKPITLLDDETKQIKLECFDQLMMDIVDTPSASYCVVDIGAGTFLPFSEYCRVSEPFSVLAGMGCQVYMHVPLMGDNALHHTLNGLETLLGCTSPEVKFMVWENNHVAGPIDGNAYLEGKKLKDISLLKDPRIVAFIQMPQYMDLQKESLAEMKSRFFTFSQAIDFVNTTECTPELKKVFVWHQSRLSKMKQALWDQMAEAKLEDIGEFEAAVKKGKK